MNDDTNVWLTPTLFRIMNHPTAEDRVRADLEMISLDQYMHNKFIDQLKRHYLAFDKTKPMKLSWWKCWFWMLLPKFILGVDPIKFKEWNIGHCLNCNANPYDGVVEAWSYSKNWFRGALIRCNKCNQLRWQPGEIVINY